MKITFKKNPVGRFNLAYEINETVDLPKELAEEIIEAGIAIPAGSEKESSEEDEDGNEVENAESKATSEKAVSKADKKK